MFLSARDLTFRYTPENAVIQNLSFGLVKGQTLAIVGSSGCGKSTLLRIISGILPNISQHQLGGSVTINQLSPDEYRRSSRLAFMFQEPTLLPNLSVRDNISFPLTLTNQKNDSDVAYLMEAVGLTKFADFLPKQLSGGMKTRVALARSFITRPELLLLDEPFSALDIAWKSKLYFELEKLRTEYQTTIVIVSHDIQEALLLSNTIIVLNPEGRIESRFDLPTNKNVYERVNNISEFMNQVYADYMLPIQDSIIMQKQPDEKAVTLSTL
jgi:ABC-type nitrate/sulfonate/bicarbonate transport system ATPase subunit